MPAPQRRGPNRQFTLKRQIGNVAIVSGGFGTIDLPRDYDYQAICLRINASLQVTGAAASVRAESPVQLVPRVEVIADGKNNIASAPFWAFCQGNVDRLLTQSGARMTTPPSGTGVATYAVEAIGIIDLSFFQGVRPKDSNFRSAGLSLLQLRLTFGAAGDAFVGGTVVYSGAPVVEVWVCQMVERGGADRREVLKKVSFQEIAIQASNANLELQLPAGNHIQRVLLRTDGLVTAGEPSTGVLNKLQLSSGVDVRHSLSGAQVRAQNNADYGQVQAGYYVADFTKTGWGGNIKLADLWAVRGNAQPKAILDVVGGANVKAQAVTTEFIPLRG